MPSPTPAATGSPAVLAVYLSGGGRTLLNIHDEILAGRIPARIGLVVSSKDGAGAERARARGLNTVVVTGEIPAETNARLLSEHGIGWVVLAGYLKLFHIPRGFEGRVLNIHPALLPKFGGPGMYGHHVHEAVLRTGESESGCTVHFCETEYDRGEIVVQRRCPVLPTDTPDALADRVFELEKEAYPAALRAVLARTVPNAGNDSPSWGSQTA